MHVLGLTGAMMAGKDTTFRILKEEAESVGLRVERIAFADYLKISGAVVLGGLGEDPRDLSPEGRQRLVEAANDFKENGCIVVLNHRRNGTTFGAQIDGRKFWQIYGTEAHREALDEPNFWIEILLKSAKTVDDLAVGYPEVDVLVITDVRFENEALAIKDLDLPKTTIARVRRETALTPAMDHPSEAGISDHLVDHEVDNTGSLEDLKDQVSILLSVILFKEPV